jgi:arylsulfatase B
VDIVADGDYQIRLRRWPREADAAIDAPLPPAPGVPGAAAWRTRPGKAIPVVAASIEIDGQTARMKVEPGDKEAVFTLTLSQGLSTLQATFHTANDEEVGAYYAYVQRLALAQENPASSDAASSPAAKD